MIIQGQFLKLGMFDGILFQERVLGLYTNDLITELCEAPQFDKLTEETKKIVVKKLCDHLSARVKAPNFDQLTEETKKVVILKLCAAVKATSGK